MLLLLLKGRKTEQKQPLKVCYKKAGIKNFAKCIEKHLWRCFICLKVTGSRAISYLLESQSTTASLFFNFLEFEVFYTCIYDVNK